jgi:hypothetical protein
MLFVCLFVLFVLGFVVATSHLFFNSNKW